MPQHPEVLPLRWGKQRLGREGYGAEITIPDRAVSKEHAEVFCLRERVVITDLSSRNGIFVNRRPLRGQVELERGDVLRLGDTLLVLEQGPWPGSLRDIASTVAHGSLPVIVQGNSGTGKDRVARYIHEASGRSGSFVAVNCARFRGPLVESVLFGHEQSAFTGATKAHKGFFVCADKGTLFLDEVAELSLEVQAQLLRVLQTRLVLPVGANHEVHTDVRIIAASATDLDLAVREGRFRADLLFRLSGRFARLPPLCEHRARILPVIVELSAEKQAELELTIAAAEELLLELWPNNVRGLDMFVSRAGEDLPVDTRGRRLIDSDDLPTLLEQGRVGWRSSRPAAPKSQSPPQAPRRARYIRAAIDRRHLELLLNAHQWNVSKVASLLQRPRKTIHRWIKRYGLSRPDKRMCTVQKMPEPQK